SSNGKDLGQVTALSDQSFMIEKGWLFPKEYVASYSLISSIREGEIWLSMSDDQLREAAATAERGAIPAGAAGLDRERCGERLEGERLEGKRLEAQRPEGQRVESQRPEGQRVESERYEGE